MMEPLVSTEAGLSGKVRLERASPEAGIGPLGQAAQNSSLTPTVTLRPISGATCLMKELWL